MPVFRMPEVAESVVEGEIGKWLVKEGDFVEKDQMLVEILTEKVNVEVPSPFRGRIKKLLAREGQIVKVGEPILEYEGEGTPAQDEEAPAAAPTAAPPPKTRPAKVKATPAVRALARKLGVDLEKVQGTGPGGRITKEDVERAAKGIPKQEEKPVQQLAEKPVERVPYRGKRRMIGKHMRTSVDTAAHTLYVEEADVTRLVELRENLKPVAEKQGLRLTYLPFIIRALTRVLPDHPYLNATLDEENEEIVLKKYYNIGISVDTPDGLVVPNIKNADQKSLFQLARELEDLVERARANRLRVEEVEDGTFTITSAGNIGGLLSMPIINYPEVAILGVHPIRPRPVVLDNDIAIRDMVYFSVTFDHRVVDGAEVARFVRDLVEVLQAPERLLLDE